MLLLLACTGPAPSDSTLISNAVPVITTATVDCDRDAGRWSFAVTTDAWTGNGQVVLSADGVYVERHPMYSSKAAADGTSDRLELTLDVVPDWRDVALGDSTVFNCNTSALAGVLRVWSRDGEDEADCRAFGDTPERFADWGIGVSCDAVLEE